MQRVLAIDADPTTLASVQGILESEDRIVDLARTAAQARGALEAATYDLIVADLLMPELSGQALFEYCEARAAGSGARILYLTAGPVSAELHQFLEQTKRPCLNKPIHLRRFLDRAEDILAGVQPDDSL